MILLKQCEKIKVYFVDQYNKFLTVSMPRAAKPLVITDQPPVSALAARDVPITAAMSQ